MRLGALATTFMLTVSTPAFAQNLDPLYEALNKLPDVLLTNPEPAQAYFVDTTVLRVLAERQGTTFYSQARQRATLAGMLPLLSALQSSNVDSWNEKAGIDLERVRYFAGFGSPPYTVTVWGLEDNAAATGLIEAISADDFSPMGADGVVGNGEPMAFDPSKADPGNPWRSRVGAATFAAARFNTVVQSSVPDALPMMLGEFPNLEANPVVKTMTTGLETAVGDHMIVQAMLISPTFGMSRGNPMDLLAPEADNFDAIRDNIIAQLEAGAEGVPPYFGGLIVDAQGDHPAVAISLAYADCDTAKRAADLMVQRWIDTMPEAAQGTTATDAVPSGDALCAATLTITGDSTDITAKPIFGTMFDAYMRQSFSVLQIGEQ